MKNKLLIASVCGLFAFNCTSSAGKLLSVQDIKKQSEALLAKAGIEILPYNQVSIVPSDKYLNDKNLKADPNIKFEQESIRKYLAMNEEQQKNGYVNQDESRAKELMEMKHVAPHIRKLYEGNFEPSNTSLRMTINDMPMAYKFVGVPDRDMQLNIGVAPFGSYRLVKEGAIQNGWDGAVQFFDNEEVGSCAFTEHNRKLAGAGAEILKEFVTYEINDKPTVILVTGNDRSGFVYKIKWYTDIFNRELECANPKFSQKLRSNVISLAQHIESFQ